MISNPVQKYRCSGNNARGLIAVLEIMSGRGGILSTPIGAGLIDSPSYGTIEDI